MFKTTADPADCEVRYVMRFLNAKNITPAEIHRQLVEIYGENVMTDGMDRQGILLVEFLPRGETINAVRYCETLRKMWLAIQNKRRGMLSQGIVLLHDNTRPHSAGVTQNLIQQFGWERFDHPPYSPDLALSDYHLFLNLKRDFRRRHFYSDEDAENGVQQSLSSLAASFFEEGVDKLVFHYDKCVNNGGNYVEK
ncbi:Histone-lysine N-methyltransferase SETMAR [Araneus ventricosus]|uniref:Histone-lysine N-methyltransferase SETMAR n=1 Tax=Araneus ventricosus TaxID=182803 RepID=A0A4Y2SX91_ARAVE|nr:Histone-lysine N-methyltransferase SETMAR [Araneus ventricosus]